MINCYKVWDKDYWMKMRWELMWFVLLISSYKIRFKFIKLEFKKQATSEVNNDSPSLCGLADWLAKRSTFARDSAIVKVAAQRREETAKIATNQDPNVIEKAHKTYKAVLKPTVTVHHEQKPIQVNIKASDQRDMEESVFSGTVLVPEQRKFLHSV